MGESKTIIIVSTIKNNFRQAIKSHSQKPRMICRFQGIGSSPATLINDTSISCVTPKKIPENVKSYNRYTSKLFISINGVNYYDSGQSIIFKEGKGTNIGTIIGSIVVVLVIIIIIIIVLCQMKKRRRKNTNLSDIRDSDVKPSN